MDKKQLQKNILEAEYDQAKWIDVLRNWFGAKELFQTPEEISQDNQDWRDYVKEAFELGKFYTDDGDREVGVFEIQLTEKAWLERNRVKLRSLLNSVYSNADGALIVFVQEDKWRFSYVSEIRIRDENDRVIIQKTEPKRYTYLFGEGENCRTAANRFDRLKDKEITLDDLNEAFSVEKLNKEFFDKYKKHFENFWMYLKDDESYYELLHDSEKEDEEKQTKPIRDFVKILLGRLVFLQFLQKKRWMGGVDWETGDVKYVKNLFDNFDGKTHFHSTALRTLFFETLNRKRENDLAPTILGDNIKIPYLNGGLFEADISAKHAIDFPPDYFKELFDFFEQYNFTIDENDAFDREVGIDPEMLGHIFENLLEENREKGAFYTPKEIVEYMCQESLIEYLASDFGGDERKNIEQLVRHKQVSENIQRSHQTANAINELLKRVKICDPAIGSGAFPMGLLKEIFECRRLLFGFLQNNESFDAATLKKEIIHTNIYGVDKESGAVDIARLRFWLALVVDEKVPQPLPNLDYKIMQGDSLLERFEEIDLSKLISAENDDGLMVTDQLVFGEGVAFPVQMTIFDKADKETLYELINLYFDPDEWEKRHQKILDKAKLKKQINDIVEGKIHAHVLNEKRKLEHEVSTYEKFLNFVDESKRKTNTKDYKAYIKQKEYLTSLDETESKLIALQQTTEKPFFLWHLWFKDVFDKGGFDIVIGNPPYIQLQKMGVEADMLEKADFQTFARTGDIYCLFYEQSVDVLKQGGTLCFITSSQWMRAGYGKKLRKYFSNQNPLQVINLGPGVFPSATVDTNIFIGQKGSFQNKLLGTAIKYKDEIESLKMNDFELMKDVSEDAWIVLDSEQRKIKKLIESKGKPLEKWDIKINFGIKTGLNTAFLIDKEKRDSLINEDLSSKKIIKPLLRGRDIQKYVAEFEEQYLIGTFPSLNLDINDFPAIKDYLSSFKPKINQTGETFINSEGKKEKSRKRTFNEWFETQDQIGYKDEFLKEKVIWKRIGSIMRFAYSNEEIYCLDSTCIATGEKIKYLTALLNSRVSLYQLFESAPKTGMGDMIISVQALDPLLVYYPSDDEEKYFNIFVDYLTFLHDKTTPKVNQYTDNKSIAAIFEDVLNMMVYELYFEEHLKENEIDVLQFVDTENIFRDISGLEDETAKAEIIGSAYKWLQQTGNPIRDRISLANIKSKDIIRRINSTTH